MDLERAVGRLISAGTYVAIVIVALGVAAMTLTGRSPLEPGVAPFDPGRLPAELAAGRAEGLLWVGLVVAIATPAARVAAALVGYAARGERTMTAISAGILGVIALGVVLALGTG